MILRPPRSTPLYSSAASDVYKRQLLVGHEAGIGPTGPELWGRTRSRELDPLPSRDGLLRSASRGRIRLLRADVRRCGGFFEVRNDPVGRKARLVAALARAAVGEESQRKSEDAQNRRAHDDPPLHRPSLPRGPNQLVGTGWKVGGRWRLESLDAPIAQLVRAASF